ncbi:hypothetical protein [Rhodococcoides corynebacterioides]|uniref:hypothetical protein n=1 Tax=Rhodococcoides corynebacterioides TaxID=53972 RepID=UPI001C9B0A60|nr:hypothetical protein [Rhodococcus corynebacterioides]MBY6364326.1 hypothetical protein [Rhodococcus corynebacterioides]
MGRVQDDGSTEADAVGTEANTARDAQRRSRDVVWSQGAALAPLFFFGMSVPANVVLAGAPAPIGDAVTTWMVLGAFSFVVFFALAALSFVGAARLRSAHGPLGRWLVSIAAAAAMLVHAGVVFSVVESVAVPATRSPDSWAPKLNANAAALVVFPYIAAAAANVYVLIRLWRRHRAPRDVRAIGPGTDPRASTPR